MSKRIQVTGFFEIEDDEYDPGRSGPLTQDAFEEAQDITLGTLDDVNFEVAE